MQRLLGISLEGWLTIAAMVTGPIAALLIQKYLEERRAKIDRKIKIFQTLMANRAGILAAAWVQAFNGIETEFYGETKVIDAWREVVDHLYSSDANDPKRVEQWTQTLYDHVNNMLYEIAESLGYHFDKVAIKRQGYNPRGWGEVEQEQHKLRKQLVELLDGKRKLPITASEETAQELVNQKANSDPGK